MRTRNSRIVVQPGAVGFRVRHRDTLGAVYRVDGGSPVHWRDRYPALVADGINLADEGLDSPTASIVWLPTAELAGAHVVVVRAASRFRPKAFGLAQLDTALAEARRLGCPIQPLGR